MNVDSANVPFSPPDPELEAKDSRTVLILLAVALIPLFSHVFVPMEIFIHRFDDAFYYFDLATNYPEAHRWTYDGVEPTNGVQPLWAILLSAVSQGLHWMGISDLGVLARLFVGLAIAFHAGATLLLFKLVRELFGLTAGTIAACAFLFPMGIVWGRVSGSENALYAFMVTLTLCYARLNYEPGPNRRKSILLGVCLGLTALARLNAGILIPCMLAYLLARPRSLPFRDRFINVFIIGAIASMIVLPYFAFNHRNTGHILPISGRVKNISTAAYLESHGIEDRASAEYLGTIYREQKEHVSYFIKARALDALAPLGARIIAGENTRVRTRSIVFLCAGLFMLPLIVGPFTGSRVEHFDRLLGGLISLMPLFVFAILNAMISLFMYPTQARYAMIRWWLVESEIAIVIVVAVIAAAALTSLTRWVGRPALRPYSLAAILLIGTGWSAYKTHSIYWTGEMVSLDYNRSWNDYSYRAARHAADQLPRDAIIGSWNAGVFGYFAPQRVINLDGLINNDELLESMKSNRIDDYIERKGIRYLADMGIMIDAILGESWRRETIYEDSYPPMKTEYRIEELMGRDESPEAENPRDVREEGGH